MTTARLDRSRGATAVLRMAMPTASRFLPSLALGALASACAVALLATSAWLITRAAEQPPILYLEFGIVGVRAFALGRAFFGYVERLRSHDAAFRTLGALRVGIYERLVRLGPDAGGRVRRGDLLARLVGDVDRLQDLPLRVVQPVATAGVVAVASVAAIATVQPAVATVLAVAIAVSVAVAILAQSRLAGADDRRLATLRGEATDAALDHLTRLDVLQAFDAERDSRAQVERVQAQLARAHRRRAWSSGVVAAVGSLASGATVLSAMLLAGGRLNGPLLAMVVLTPIAVFEAVGVVPPAASAWREVRSAATRVATAAPGRIPVEVPTAPLVPLAVPADTTIELEAVSARWPGSTSPALDRVRLRLAPGDCLMVTGPSGAGKTTLAHVLVRMLDYSGSYRIGGVEARRLDPDAVRRVVGLCEQSPHLFDESIRQNLLFARDDATEEELLDVIASVGLGAWVAERGGLDAPVGERGVLVSGGQAQRIALARALLARFPVLVLDEPTANVDAPMADALLGDLLAASATAGRAVVLISHLPVDSSRITSELRLAAPA